MIALRRWRWVRNTVLFLSQVLPITVAFGQTLPQTGAELDDQIRLAAHGGHVLWIVPRPGAEDIPSMRYLRFVEGYRTSVLFVTNGESLPIRGEEWSQRTTEAERKESAWALARTMGNTYFLNVPDRLWAGVQTTNADSSESIVRELVSIVRSVRPTIIAVARDRVWKSESSRTVHYLLRSISMALDSVSQRTEEGRSHPGRAASWNIHFVAADTGQTTGWVVPAKHRNSDELTAHSLAYPSIAFPNVDVPRGRYVWIAPKGKTSASAAFWPKPMPASAEMKSVKRLVDDALGAIRSRNRNAAANVHKVLSAMSRQMAQGLDRFTVEDRRLFVSWKGSFDHLSYLLSGARLHVTLSESLLTDRQVMYLRVRGVPALLKSGTLQAYFQLEPGDRWIINLTVNRSFDLLRDTTFEIISPDRNEYSNPVAVHGLTRTSLRDPFRVSFLYKSNEPFRSFIETKEFQLGFAPRHSAYALNPIVAATENEPLVVEGWNYSRDAVEGSFFVSDSVVGGISRTFMTGGKDSWRRDTVRLAWTMPESVQVHRADLKSGSKVVESFEGRVIPFTHRIPLKVFLLSSPNRSLERSLARVLVSPPVVAETVVSKDLDSVDVLVVDVSGLKDFRPSSAVAEWIGRGGRAVYLNVSGRSTLLRQGKDSVWVMTTAAITPDTPIMDTGLQTKDAHVQMTGQDWNGWSTPRGFGTVKASPGLTPRVLVKMASGETLAVAATVGEGRVIASSLYLTPLLTAVSEGGHRLLASLLTAE